MRTPIPLTARELSEIDRLVACVSEAYREEIREQVDAGLPPTAPEVSIFQAVLLIAIYHGISAARAERSLRKSLESGELDSRWVH